MMLTYQEPQIDALSLPWMEILLNCPTGLVWINAAGQVNWLNPAAEQLLGSQWLNQSWLAVITTVFMPRDDDGHQVSLADGRIVHVALATLGDQPGQLVVLTDLTTTRIYEEVKEDQKRLAHIGTMTAQLAHQIRTPLASATLLTDHLIHNSQLDQKAKQWLSRLRDCHQSIEQQIQDLLLFARGQSIMTESIEIKAWLELLRQRVESLTAEGRLELRIDNQADHSLMNINPEAFTGAILNLIDNALEAGANRIHCTLLSPLDHLLQLRLEDNGAGMSEDTLREAFSPFYTTKAKGTGLGLAVVAEVVKAHGGIVKINSGVNKGTVVELTLPA